MHTVQWIVSIEWIYFVGRFYGFFFWIHEQTSGKITKKLCQKSIAKKDFSIESKRFQTFGGVETYLVSAEILRGLISTRKPLFVITAFELLRQAIPTF